MTREEASVYILRKLVVDSFIIIGLILCIFAEIQLWQPFERGFFCGDQSLMFPYKKNTITTLQLRVVSLALPTLAFLVCEWVLLRKAHDSERCPGVRIQPWVRGFYCILASFATGLCFVEISIGISKNTTGRLRPHFFDVCQPSVNCTASEWQNRYIQPFEYHCTGSHTDMFMKIRKSFLSGHAAWSAYSMLYLAMYLESRMTWSGTRLLRHALQFAAVMFSWFTALSRVSDFKHHWSDVLAGYSLGAIFAVVMWTWGTDVVQKGSQCVVTVRDLSPVPNQGGTSRNNRIQCMVALRGDNFKCDTFIGPDLSYRVEWLEKRNQDTMEGVN